MKLKNSRAFILGVVLSLIAVLGILGMIVHRITSEELFSVMQEEADSVLSAALDAAAEWTIIHIKLEANNKMHTGSGIYTVLRAATDLSQDRDLTTYLDKDKIISMLEDMYPKLEVLDYKVILTKLHPFDKDLMGKKFSPNMLKQLGRSYYGTIRIEISAKYGKKKKKLVACYDVKTVRIVPPNPSFVFWVARGDLSRFNVWESRWGGVEKNFFKVLPTLTPRYLKDRNKKDLPRGLIFIGGGNSLSDDMIENWPPNLMGGSIRGYGRYERPVIINLTASDFAAIGGKKEIRDAVEKKIDPYTHKTYKFFDPKTKRGVYHVSYDLVHLQQYLIATTPPNYQKAMLNRIVNSFSFEVSKLKKTNKALYNQLRWASEDIKMIYGYRTGADSQLFKMCKHLVVGKSGYARGFRYYFPQLARLYKRIRNKDSYRYDHLQFTKSGLDLLAIDDRYPDVKPADIQFTNIYGKVYTQCFMASVLDMKDNKGDFRLVAIPYYKNPAMLPSLPTEVKNPERITKADLKDYLSTDKNSPWWKRMGSKISGAVKNAFSIFDRKFRNSPFFGGRIKLSIRTDGEPPFIKKPNYLTENRYKMLESFPFIAPYGFNADKNRTVWFSAMKPGLLLAPEMASYRFVGPTQFYDYLQSRGYLVHGRDKVLGEEAAQLHLDGIWYVDGLPDPETGTTLVLPKNTFYDGKGIIATTAGSSIQVNGLYPLRNPILDTLSLIVADTTITMAMASLPPELRLDTGGSSLILSDRPVFASLTVTPQSPSKCRGSDISSVFFRRDKSFTLRKVKLLEDKLSGKASKGKAVVPFAFVNKRIQIYGNLNVGSINLKALEDPATKIGGGYLSYNPHLIPEYGVEDLSAYHVSIATKVYYWKLYNLSEVEDEGN